MIRLVVCNIVLVLLITTPGFAATYTVPGNFGTIQDAINGAITGDTIIVKAGTYMENIDFMGKDIIVKSESGAAVTIIDGGELDSVVIFDKGETNLAVLDGFTLTNGLPYRGGGVHCSNASSPTVKNNIINKNKSKYYGGGVHISKNSAPKIINNEISENEASYGGGGFNVDETSAPLIQGNLITHNQAAYGGGGINVDDASTPQIIGNTITFNKAEYRGGGVYCYDGSSAVIANNMITFNEADYYGGGISCRKNSDAIVTNNTFTKNYGDYRGGAFHSDDSSPVVTNCILWDNDGGSSSDKEYYFQNAGTPTISYSNVKGGAAGTGNINTDPLFVNPAGNDFHIVLNSPCTDAGDSTAVIGAYDFEGDPRITGKHVDIGGDEVFNNSLLADVSVISEAAGGTINFTLDAGVLNGGRNYLMFANVTGTTPGFTPPPGLVTIPINWDIFTNLALSLTNTSIFQNFYGALDSNGQSTAIFTTLGPFTGGAGLTLNFAFGMEINYWDFASNPVSIDVVP